MFKKLHNKLKSWIFFSITAILLTTFFSSFLHSYNALYNDYISKTTSLSKQYTQTCELKLKEIENIISSFINYKQIGEMIQTERYNYEINNTLISIKSRSLDIISATVLTKGDTVYYSSNTSDQTFLKTILSGDYEQYKNMSIVDVRWIVHNLDSNGDYILVCSFPIIQDGVVSGYLFANVSPSVIDKFDFRNNIFLKDASLFLVCDDELFCIYGDNVPNLKRSTNDVSVKDGAILTNVPVDDTNANIVMYLPITKFSKETINVLLCMIVILVFLLALCYWGLELITNQLISNLTSLNTQITDFIASKKGETP